MLWREDPQQSILFYNSQCCLTGWEALPVAQVDESLRVTFLPLIIQEMCKLCFGVERSVPGSWIVTGKQKGMRKGDKHGRWEIRGEPEFGGEHNIELGVIYIIPSKLLPCQDYTNEPNTTALEGSAHLHRPHTLVNTHTVYKGYKYIKCKTKATFTLSLIIFLNTNVYNHSSLWLYTIIIFWLQCIQSNVYNHNFLITVFTVSISHAFRIHFIVSYSPAMKGNCFSTHSL